MTGMAGHDPGISGHVRPESLVTLLRNTQLATLRIEKLSTSESLKPSLQAYIEGKKTTTDLLNEVKAKYVALRRG